MCNPAYRPASGGRSRYCTLIETENSRLSGLSATTSLSLSFFNRGRLPYVSISYLGDKYR